MANKNKENRIQFKLSDFLVKKLSFKNNVLLFGTNVSVNELSKITGISEVSLAISAGLDKTQINHILDDEQIAEIAIANNFEFEKIDDISEENVVSKILKIMAEKKWPKEDLIETRAPIITIMGHVDHGKTTLLDVIRKSHLTKKEVGGITQTIGAYQIEFNGKKLTFIDTPGHEAFTEMRANGSKVTDIAIIVVAADDALMPQTKESIDHAKAAGVPIIVAVNKMDVVGADMEKVIKQMAEYNVIAEQWGGDVPFVPISALKGEGIDKLMENLLLTAEVLELKAPTNILASGTVIESNIHKQKGNLISVIIQNGTLKVGDKLIVDDFMGNVKAMHDDNGKMIQEATPGTPVEIYGIGASPNVGSNFVVSIDKDTQKIADVIHNARLNRLRKRHGKSVEDLFALMENSKKSFNIILKADALGVLNAIAARVEQISSEDIEVKIIRKEVGEITSTDVILAEASNAHIYTFNTKTSQQIFALTKNKNINIFEFDIIYKLFEDIEDKINGLTEDKFEKIEIGRAIIKQIFNFSKIGKIAGSEVKKGVVKMNSLISIVRDGKNIFDGEIESLKIGKDSVKEVTVGRECGIVIKNLNIDIKEGDELIIQELVKK